MLASCCMWKSTPPNFTFTVPCICVPAVIGRLKSNICGPPSQHQLFLLSRWRESSLRFSWLTWLLSMGRNRYSTEMERIEHNRLELCLSSRASRVFTIPYGCLHLCICFDSVGPLYVILHTSFYRVFLNLPRSWSNFFQQKLNGPSPTVPQSAQACSLQRRAGSRGWV